MHILRSSGLVPFERVQLQTNHSRLAVENLGRLVRAVRNRSTGGSSSLGGGVRAHYTEGRSEVLASPTGPRNTWEVKVLAA